MSDTAANRHLSQWLSKFGKALEREDIKTAVAMFAKDSYWRDLIAFTWNIKTAEGHEAIKAMLEATLSGTRPTGWRLEGEETQADGVTEGWFTFETSVARGDGQ